MYCFLNLAGYNNDESPRASVLPDMRNYWGSFLFLLLEIGRYANKAPLKTRVSN